MKRGVLAIVVVLAVTACMYGCVLFGCWPVFHKPAHDPSPLILALKVPEEIETLRSMPRDETIAENGIHIADGRWRNDGVKELFRITKGPMSLPHAYVTYTFKLFYSEQDAKKQYEFYKNDEFHRPFFVGESDDRAYVVRYDAQDRRGDTGTLFCETSPWRMSYAAFRLKNLFIEVEVTDKTGNPQALALAVEHLADLLAREWDQGY